MLMAAVMFGVVGAGLLVFGGQLLVKTKRERAPGSPVEGRVVEVKREDRRFIAVWEATTPSGEAVRAAGPLRYSRSPTVGDAVQLLYVPGAAQPLLPGGLMGYLAPLICLAIGAGFSTVPLFIFSLR